MSVIIISVTKFAAGAWIVILIIPIIILIMTKIRRHYEFIAQQLDIPNELLKTINMEPHFNHIVVIPIDSFNGMPVKTLRYANTLSDNVYAFHVEQYKTNTEKLITHFPH